MQLLKRSNAAERLDEKKQKEQLFRPTQDSLNLLSLVEQGTNAHFLLKPPLPTWLGKQTNKPTEQNATEKRLCGVSQLS